MFINNSTKNIIAILFLIISFAPLTMAQKSKTQLLKEPYNWEFERFALPPAFAPDILYNGVEELRFSPGMFNKDSSNYFTYAFVARLDTTANVSQDNIRNYLLNYFKGLCSSTAKDRKLKVDTTQITVSIERKKGMPGREIIYNALLDVFGVFADGAPVKLNMEVKVLINSAMKKTYLFFIASPHQKTDNIWKQLYALQKDFDMPL